MPLVLSKKETAELLGVSLDTVTTMEQRGVLHRLEKLPGVKFSKEEVRRLATLPEDYKTFSPWERNRLEQIIAGKDEEIERLKRLLAGVKELAEGGDK